MKIIRLCMLNDDVKESTGSDSEYRRDSNGPIAEP